MRAVRFDRFGEIDVLEVREAADPRATSGRAVVAVKAAGLNPGEIFVRQGLAAKIWPTTFPSGQGSDFAGHIVTLGGDVTGFAVGDPVLGWTDERASQAELVAVPAGHLIIKPPQISWEVAGSLFTAGAAAVASVRAVAAGPGETIVVSGAAGGVGSIAVQLARRYGATVLGIASKPNHDWLHSAGVLPVAYGDGLAERLRQAAGGQIDAFIDTYGAGYAELAISLGVSPQRISTTIDIDAVKRHGAQFAGTADAASTSTLTELTALLASGQLEVPIARTYPLEQVQDAYRDLGRRHTRGKIALTI